MVGGEPNRDPITLPQEPSIMIRHTDTDGDDSLVTNHIFPMKENDWYGFEPVH